MAENTDREENAVDVVVEHDVDAHMRDGVVLRGDVYHPIGSGRYPVLLCRTPYNKAWERFDDISHRIARRGYTVVVQDTRGRYTSDGEFTWQFRDRDETSEAEDGYDTVEWAAQLQWADGRVGLWGHSYDGWNGWMAASANPPSLEALVASGISQNLLDLTSGIFETGRRLLWTYKMAADIRRRHGETDGPTTSAQAIERWEADVQEAVMWCLPLDAVPQSVFGGLTDQLRTYLHNPSTEFWRLGEFHSEVTVPVMQITGWWDRLIGASDNYAGVVADGPHDLRGEHRLIIGPWGHDVTDFPHQIGPIDYGPLSRVHYADLLIRWFDHVLKGIDNGMASEDPVQLFILGENRWRGETAWPPVGTRDLVYYLSSGGNANTVRGDGRLEQSIPQREGRDTFLYDPSDPVMSLMSPDYQTAPVDQAPHDHQQDILVYEADPFERDVDLVGPVVVNLWARTDGPDTDWAITLAIVHEDGLAVNLTYGIVRARYRNGYESPELLEPGRTYPYRIDLNPIGSRFRSGERLRLYVSSSDFPNFDRNHNTGDEFWRDDQLRVASQIVFHGPSMPSHVVLPLAPIDDSDVTRTRAGAVRPPDPDNVGSDSRGVGPVDRKPTSPPR